MAGCGGGTRLRSASATSSHEAVVESFAGAWQARAFDKANLRFAGSTPQAVAKDFAATTSGLGSGPVAVSLDGVRRTGTTARAVLDVTWTLPGSVSWRYRTPVAVAETSAGWAVQAPATGSYWHPELKAGDTLRATRTWGERGDLLDRDGEPLMPIGKVYPVQIDPARATAATASALEKVVDEPAGLARGQARRRHQGRSKAPIPVITYRQADFDDARHALDALKGVIYPAREQPLAKPRTFAQPLLGSFGAGERRARRQEQGQVCRGRLRRASAASRGSTTPCSAARPGSRSPRARRPTPRCSSKDAGRTAAT